MCFYAHHVLLDSIIMAVLLLHPLLSRIWPRFVKSYQAQGKISVQIFIEIDISKTSLVDFAYMNQLEIIFEQERYELALEFDILVILYYIFKLTAATLP